MKKNTRLACFVLIPAVFVFLLYIIPNIKRTSSDSPSPPILDYSSLEYAKIERSSSITNAIRDSVYSADSRNVPQSIKNKSIDSILNFIFAYSEGTWDAFRAFRYPVDDQFVRINSSFYNNTFISNYLFSIAGSANAESDAELVKNVWINHVKNARINDGIKLYCTDCWDYAAVNDIDVVFHDVNYKLPGLQQYTGNKYLKCHSFSPSVKYVPHIEELINDSQLKHAVFVSIIVRTTDQMHYPVNVAFYFDPLHGEWLPYEVTTGELLLLTESSGLFF